MSRFGRRDLLKSAGTLGAAAAALGWVDPLIRTARAAAPPKRLLVFFSPLGAVLENWMPSGSETGFTFNSALKPLDPHKSQLIVCKGLKQPSEQYTGNHKEMCGLLSGRMASGRDDASSPSAISVDQVLAADASITGGTAFPSVSLAAWQSRYYSFQKRADHMYLSARGAGQAVIPEGLPQAAFDRLFGGFTAPTGGTTPDPTPVPDPKNARRRSVLDAVTKELNAVQNRLGATSPERAKIDQHLTSIRELEQRLVDMPFTGGGGSAGCTVPTRPGGYAIDDDKTLDARFRMQIDNAVSALACDRTRIVLLTGEGGESFATHPWLGINKQYHEHTHGDGQTEQTAINKWYAEQFAYMLGRMSEIEESNGSLLDNTAVAWISEQGCRTGGEKHMRTNMPYIVAGSCGGYFRTGRFVDFAGASTTRFLINLKNAMGSAGNSFGSINESPLPNMT